MRKTLLLVVVLLLGTGGYYYLAHAQPVDPPQIMRAAVSTGDIVEQVQTTGTLEPVRTISIGSQVSGVVAALHADFNAIVKTGQIIAQLDQALFQVQVDLQHANYERQLGEIVNQESQLEHARTQLDRTQALFEKSLATQEQLDQAVLTAKTRTNAVESARRQLLTAKASLDQAKLNLSYTTIRSPIDGIVVSRDVDVGQTVQSSVNVAQFFTLATDLRQLKLTAAVDEAEIGKIQPGAPVIFTVDAYPAERFFGTVAAVHLNATTTSNVVTYPIVIDSDNPELKLRPGMTATVRILTSTARNVQRIPNQALRFRPTPDIYATLGLTAPATTQSRTLRASGEVRDGGNGRADRNADAGADRQRASATTGKNADKIDALFARPPSRMTAGRVWVWDESTKRLTDVPVTTGVSDGTYSEIISGDLAVDQQVVTAVVVAQAGAQANATTSTLFGGGGRGFGGPPPGGFPGGGRGN